MAVRHIKLQFSGGFKKVAVAPHEIAHAMPAKDLIICAILQPGSPAEMTPPTGGTRQNRPSYADAAPHAPSASTTPNRG